MFYRVILLSFVVVASSTTGFTQDRRSQASAQERPAQEEKAAPEEKKVETPAERLQRLGTLTDPGPNPDPTTVWIRLGKRYTIEKFPKKGAAFDRKPGTVRPLAYINLEREIYQEDDEFVWVWQPVFDDPVPKQTPTDQSPAVALQEEISKGKYREYTAEQFEFVKQLKAEFNEVVPPKSGKVLRFRESSKGLPNGGSWRNSLDVADMNGDGHVDLIVPPQRGGYASTTPFIFLGDSKGNWTLWEEVEWPSSAAYGSVAVGDLNGDKKLDLVLGMHLTGVAAFLGDGRGKFTEASEGLPTDFPTRRASLVDYDLDGDLDIAALSEGPTLRDGGSMTDAGLLRIYSNEGKASSWKRVDVPDDNRRQLAGDYLAIGKFNNDKYPDFAASSIIFHGTDIIHLSEGKGRWKSFGRGWFPFYSYYNGVVAGKFTKSSNDDIIYAFSRTWTSGADPKQIEPPPFRRLVGLELVSFANGKSTRTPIFRTSATRSIFAIGSADLDLDKNLDVAFFKPEEGRVRMLLGNGKGAFEEAAVEGVELGMHTTYEVRFADVNRDGRPDLLLMFEDMKNAKDGSIRVFLNEGTSVAAGADAE